MAQVRTQAGLGALAQAGANKALAYSPVWLPATVTRWVAPGPEVDERGTTRSYGARVDVQIQILSVREIPAEGDLREGETLRRSGGALEAVGPYPPLVGLPVAYPGPRAFRLRGPIAVGETGWVVVPTRGMIVWRAGEKDQDPAIGIGAPRLESAIFVPGIELGPDEAHTDWTDYTIGGPAGNLGQLALSPLGQWTLRSPVGVDVRAPSTSIGATGGGIALAKNAQVIAALTAFNASLQGGVAFTNPQKLELAAALAQALIPLVGTLTLTAE